MSKNQRCEWSTNTNGLCRWWIKAVLNMLSSSWTPTQLGKYLRAAVSWFLFLSVANFLQEIDVGRCLGSCTTGNRCLLRYVWTQLLHTAECTPHNNYLWALTPSALSMLTVGLIPTPNVLFTPSTLFWDVCRQPVLLLYLNHIKIIQNPPSKFTLHFAR